MVTRTRFSIGSPSDQPCELGVEGHQIVLVAGEASFDLARITTTGDQRSCDHVECGGNAPRIVPHVWIALAGHALVVVTVVLARVDDQVDVGRHLDHVRAPVGDRREQVEQSLFQAGPVRHDE